MSAMAAFWVVAFLLILAPGADWAFILGASLRGNAVLSAVSGLAAGYTVMTLVVAAGVGAVVAGSQSALTVITLLGATYLVWLGISTQSVTPQARFPATNPFGRTAARSSRESVSAASTPRG